MYRCEFCNRSSKDGLIMIMEPDSKKCICNVCKMKLDVVTHNVPRPKYEAEKENEKEDEPEVRRKKRLELYRSMLTYFTWKEMGLEDTMTEELASEGLVAEMFMAEKTVPEMFMAGKPVREKSRSEEFIVEKIVWQLFSQEIRRDTPKEEKGTGRYFFDKEGVIIYE